MSEFGISRLALLNSANYELGLFPVDRPLSLFGPNNTGKTTAVNALQFLFLTDMRDMRFGKYDAPTTRKYYFPDDRSYVLAEILLEHGTYVIAAAGKGVGAGYAYQHIVYQGELTLIHYVEEGVVRDLRSKRELLERQRKSAISDLGSTLKTLRDNYRRFEIEMDTFNRNINKRAISNLTRVVVRPAPHSQILEAIEALVSSSEMDLLSIDEQTASEAARYLNRLVGERGSELGLMDLFDLNFVVFAQDARETVYRDLDQIESNGTTITIKALVNMHMMDQLLDRSPQTIVNLSVA